MEVTDTAEGNKSGDARHYAPSPQSPSPPPNPDACLTRGGSNTPGAQQNALDPKSLFSALQLLEVDEDGIVPFKLPPARDCDTESRRTEEDSLETSTEGQALYRNELLRCGSRPACSIETWINIVDHPSEPCSPLLPWITPGDESEKAVMQRRQNSLATVFEAQLRRWWEFKRWQYRQRDGDIRVGDDAAFSLYLESQKNMREAKSERGQRQHTPDEKMVRKGWELVNECYEIGEYDDEEDQDTDQDAGHDTGQGREEEQGEDPRPTGFSVYHKALKTRLAKYRFRRALQLRKDPSKQTAWTTWLEYLGFEILWLQERNADVRIREANFGKAWDRISAATKSYREENTRADISEGDSAETFAMPEEEALTFVKRTSSYRKMQLLARQQRRRVRWIADEARKTEAEWAAEIMTAQVLRKQTKDWDESGESLHQHKKQRRGNN